MNFSAMAVVAVSGIIDGHTATPGVNTVTTFVTRCKTEETTCTFRFALWPSSRRPVLIVSRTLNGRGVSCKNA